MIEKKNIKFNLDYSIHQVKAINKAYQLGQTRN
jgi:hypothetical protein